MRSFLLAGVAVLALTGTAAAGDNECVGNSCNTIIEKQVNNTNNQGGTGIGIGVSKASATAGAAAFSGSSSTVNNRNSNKQGQAQGQGQEQGQGQVQGQYNSATGSGNTTNVEVTDNVNYEASQMPGYAPDLSVHPSAPCSHVISTTGGFTAGAGVSWGLGFSYDDTECNAREAIRLGMASESPTVRAASNNLLLKLLNHASDTVDDLEAGKQVSELKSNKLSFLDQTVSVGTSDDARLLGSDGIGGAGSR